jgi:hypothetical protein
LSWLSLIQQGIKRVFIMNDFKRMADENRRDFLKFIAKAGISLPVLQASTLAMGVMSSRFAEAQTGSAKVQRVIFVYIPGGAPGGASHSFNPTGSTGNLTMNTCTQAFNSIKQNCIWFGGTSVMQGSDVSGSHGLTFRVLGAMNGPGSTVDNVLAASTIGSASRFSSLRLGIMTNTDTGAVLDTSISSTNTWNQSAYSSNPRTVFNTLFTGGGGGGGGTSTAVTQQQGIYDVNIAALQKIKAKLSAAEQIRAQQNIDAIQKLKTDLLSSNTGSPSSSCTNPSWNNYGAATASPYEGTYFTQLVDQQARNAALALACNLTKVVSIQMGTDGAKFAPTGFTEAYHDGAIHSNVESRYAAQRAYLSDRMASIINILKTTNDENGQPLFNSTLVLQVSDMGNANAHMGTDAPFMMMSGNSKFNGGRIINVGQHTSLLDTAAQAMGLSGYTNYGSGMVSGVFS